MLLHLLLSSRRRSRRSTLLVQQGLGRQRRLCRRRRRSSSSSSSLLLLLLLLLFLFLVSRFRFFLRQQPLELPLVDRLAPLQRRRREVVQAGHAEQPARLVGQNASQGTQELLRGLFAFRARDGEHRRRGEQRVGSREPGHERDRVGVLLISSSCSSFAELERDDPAAGSRRRRRRRTRQILFLLDARGLVAVDREQSSDLVVGVVPGRGQQRGIGVLSSSCCSRRNSRRRG